MADEITFYHFLAENGAESFACGLLNPNRQKMTLHLLASKMAAEIRKPEISILCLQMIRGVSMSPLSWTILVTTTHFLPLRILFLTGANAREGCCSRGALDLNKMRVLFFEAQK